MMIHYAMIERRQRSASERYAMLRGYMPLRYCRATLREDAVDAEALPPRCAFVIRDARVIVTLLMPRARGMIFILDM